MTAFVALLALDAQRIREGRLDVAPCIQLPPKYLGAAADGHNGHGSSEEPLLSAGSSDEIPVSTNGATTSSPEGKKVKPDAFTGMSICCTCSAHAVTSTRMHLWHSNSPKIERNGLLTLQVR